MAPDPDGPPGHIVQPGRPPWHEIAELPALVDWQQASAYCRWAGKALPTEEQWEAAARGPNGRRFPWGNEWLPQLGDGLSKPKVDPHSVDIGPYGCRDMLFGHEWTGARASGGRAIAKGNPQLGYSLGELLRPAEAGLWNRVAVEHVHSECAFRCVLAGRG